jgi:hypothetical protein
MGMKGYDNAILCRGFVTQEALKATRRAGKFYVLFVKHIHVDRYPFTVDR